tara:strand:+ start:281 stop:1924 length:1644 start_codon:yes stop_codon:yes gene_type:complete
MGKKRVLVVSEAHYLHSGFGTYGNELLKRLAKTNKYELAEFASYGKYSLVNDLDWLFYANMPEDDEKAEGYDPNGAAQFGAWRFDRVCLDFKPDIVLSYRDPWMDTFIKSAPVRPYFHWVWMPTVDSEPQKQEWVHTFAETDALFVYSEFGQRVLEKQATKNLNIIGCASPGIDPNVYKPILNKRAHKESFGLDPDCFIVGTVMRNQKRKLFIELMKSFRIFLDNAPKELANKTYLYLHTSYPEKNGWDIADGIISTNLSGKVLMTYRCRQCGSFDLGFFEGPITKCTKCGVFASQCPNVTFGLEIPDLVKIYNLFDLYVQYAICEGFGMPQVEAGACGVPVAATNYSAMEDTLHWLKGYKINVETMARELETNAERAYPDNNHLAKIIEKHLSLPEEKRLKKCVQTRQATKKRYTWDKTAQAWMDYIDTYKPVDQQGQWDAPPNIYNIPESIPENLDNQQFIIWLYSEFLKESHRAFSYEGNKLLCDLTCGATIEYGNMDVLDRDKLFERYKSIANNKIVCEQARAGMLSLSQDVYLTEAYKRKRS